MKKSRINTFLLILFFGAVGVRGLAASDQNITEKIRKDFATFVSLRKKMDKRPDDINLQNEAITLLGNAAFKVSFYQHGFKGIKVDMSQAEKIMIWYIYIKLLTRFRPHHYDIKLYAGAIDQAEDAETYEMKLISAEATLMYAEFESDISLTVYRLHQARKLLEGMENQPISLMLGVDYYRKCLSLDASDTFRRQLLHKIESILNSFSAEDYYETANHMLNRWLWKDKLKYNEKMAARYLAIFNISRKRLIDVGFADVNCLWGRYQEEYVGNKASALREYKMAAKAGGIDGIINAARLIISDSCRSHDEYREAFQLLRSAQQHPLFSNKGGDALLGRMYEYGIGVSQDDSLALNYYSKAYQFMRLYKGVEKWITKYERERLDRNYEKLNAIDSSINQLQKRIQHKQLLNYAQSLKAKKISSYDCLIMGCRFYQIGDETNGKSYMAQAAAMGSKEAKDILNWRRSLLYKEAYKSIGSAIIYYVEKMEKK